MLKRYTFWLTAGVLFLFLNGIIHTLSFFVTAEPKNETERQLYQLINEYHPDMGAGFHPSFLNLFTALSACYSLLCALGGFSLGYLLLKQADAELMRGMILINVIIFGVCLLLMAIFTFLPPVVLTGLVFINLLIAYILTPKPETLN